MITYLIGCLISFLLLLFIDYMANDCDDDYDKSWNKTIILHVLLSWLGVIVIFVCTIIAGIKVYKQRKK